MSFKPKFTADEWETLKKSFFWTFEAVANADEKIDKKEKKALERLINSSGKFYNDLARELLMEISKEYPQNKEKFESGNGDFVGGLKKVSEILASKVTEETNVNFKKTLVAVGVIIGHSSGSLFGSKLSDVEVKRVKEIGDLLNLEPADLQRPPNLEQILQSLSE